MVPPRHYHFLQFFVLSTGSAHYRNLTMIRVKSATKVFDQLWTWKWFSFYNSTFLFLLNINTFKILVFTPTMTIIIIQTNNMSMHFLLETELRTILVMVYDLNTSTYLSLYCVHNSFTPPKTSFLFSTSSTPHLKCSRPPERPQARKLPFLQTELTVWCRLWSSSDHWRPRLVDRSCWWSCSVSLVSSGSVSLKASSNESSSAVSDSQE